jgi:UDP-glucose 4-epimerase
VVTGGAGFIGSNLVAALEARGDDVVVVDDLSTGHERFLEQVGFRGTFVRRHLVADAARLAGDLEGADLVVHLAANADVRWGWKHPRRDLEQNLHATLNVAEAMRSVGARRLVFSSTGSVYGEAAVIPTPESCPFPVQTSLYGASKAAAEGFLAAYAEAGYLDVTVFRFVSILGDRYTHGHVIDFVRKLRHDPTQLAILGDGTQRKSYLHVSDCIAALVARSAVTERYEVYNLGVEDYCTTAQSAGWICERLGVRPRFEFAGGDRGWIGDNPFILLDTARIRATGWQPKVPIRVAVESTVDYIEANPWVLDLDDHR